MLSPNDVTKRPSRVGIRQYSRPGTNGAKVNATAHSTLYVRFAKHCDRGDGPSREPPAIVDFKLRGMGE
jgi:hypothetical protein